MGAQRAPAREAAEHPEGFGVAVVREDGKWRCTALRRAALNSLAAAETELRELRSAGAVFGLLDVDEEFLVILRPAPAGTRLLLSDATAALDYDIAAEVLDKRVDGLIVSNTTLSRAGLRSPDHLDEAGGLSGRPLFARSPAVLARRRRRLGPDLPIIGVGGVDSAETAAEKIRAGADLVQLYTGMIFAGPGLPGQIVRGLSALVERDGLSLIREIRDSALERWTQAPIA